MLRHSTAHVLAEAARHVFPGVKITIGPPIDSGFYYDFQFAEPITEADLATLENEMRRILKTRARLHPHRGDARRRARPVRGGGRAVQGRADRRPARGRADHALQPGRLHRPLPRAAPADDGADQGLQAALAGRLVLARRRAARAADARLRHGVLVAEGARRAPRSASRRPSAATIAGSARSSACSRSTPSRRAPRSGCPNGMTLWNELYGHWSKENRRRGYREVRDADHVRRVAVEDVRALGQVPRQHVHARGRRAGLRDQADELPGALPDLQARSAGRTATCRCA